MPERGIGERNEGKVGNGGGNGKNLDENAWNGCGNAGSVGNKVGLPEIWVGMRGIGGGNGGNNIEIEKAEWKFIKSFFVFLLKLKKKRKKRNSCHKTSIFLLSN